MEAPADTLTPYQLYKLMTGSVVPRPIGWISTLSEEGVANLAPFSYFAAVASDPPTLMFSAGKRDAHTQKDTFRNALASGEFVVNMVTYALAEAMNITATDAPPHADEFTLAGVTPAPSRSVAAPRVAQSPIHFECRLAHVLELGSNTLVFGRVVHIHVADEVLLEGDRIDIGKLDIVGRLAGSSYVRVRETFDLVRPPYEDMVVAGGRARAEE